MLLKLRVFEVRDYQNSLFVFNKFKGTGVTPGVIDSFINLTI